MLRALIVALIVLAAVLLFMFAANAAEENIAGIRNFQLVAAVEANDASGVADALASGADPDARTSYGMPVLVRAVILNNAGMVRAILDAGPDVDARSHGSKTALQMAAWIRNHGIAATLIDAGADWSLPIEPGRLTPAAMLFSDIEFWDMASKFDASIMIPRRIAAT